MESKAQFKRPKNSMLKKRKKEKNTSQAEKEKRTKKDPSVPEYPMIDKGQKPGEEISVNFQLVTPNKLYEESLTNLLKFNAKEIAGSSYPQLSEEIIGQEFLGCIAENADEEIEGEGDNQMKSCYGVATILKYDEHKNDQFMKDYVRFVKAKANQQGDKALLGFLDAYKGLGLLVIEKYYNLPEYIYTIMLNQLVQDQVWAVDNCVEEEDKDCFRFENLLYVAKCKKRKAKKDVVFENGTKEEIRYYSDKDEEIFNKREIGIFSEIRPEPHNNTQEYTVTDCRMIVIISYENFKEIAQVKVPKFLAN